MSADLIGLLAITGLFTWSVSVWRGGALLVRETRSAWRKGFRLDAAALVLGVSANLFNIVYELARRWTDWPNPELPIPAPVRATGLVLFSCGFMAALVARQQLAEAWTTTPGRPPDGIRTRGAYGLVRHPIYASATLVYLGLLIAQADFTGTLIFGTHIVGFIAKAVREDRLLRTVMSDEYGQYSGRVRWRLFPGLW